MARGKSSSGTTVSLFPFLAVLVCVMGSLIFLLLATTKRMHDIAVAEAASERDRESIVAAPESPDLPRVNIPLAVLGDAAAPAAETALRNPPAELDPQADAATGEMERQLAGLLRRRDELQAALRQQQALQTSAQGNIEALQASVGESQTKLRGVLAQITSFKDDLSAEQDLAELEAQIAELRQQLRKLQNRQSAGQSKFAVVPFDVRSGTTRRPILIECTDHGLRFLPENVVVTPNDLEGFTEHYNPLLAGARALMTHWTAWNMRQPNPDDKPEPYVLLMVRPNGTVGYYVAMRMLSSLKQPHGYELIDDSIALQPPPLDPEAQRVCREAVDRQLAERSNVVTEARNTFRNGTGGENSATPGRGGKIKPKSSDKFEVSDVMPPSESGEVSERSWENIERFEGRRPMGNSGNAAGGLTNRPSGVSPAPPQNLANSQPAPGHGRAPHGRAPTSGVQDGGAQSGTGDQNQPRELPETLTAEHSDATNIRRAATRSQTTAGEQSASDEDLPPSQTGDRPRTANSAGQANGSRGPMNQPPGRMAVPRGKRQRGEETGGPHAQLAQLGRRHWGDSEPQATIGIEQDVSIRVDAEQAVVADHHVVPFHQGEQSLDLFLRLMEAVDAETNTWGKPRSGFYWTPRLRFVVSPGGNQIFERIDPLTIRSGLSTTREFTLDGVSSTKEEKKR